VLSGKTGGLVGYYLDVTGALYDVVSNYTRSGGQSTPRLDISETVAQMQRDIF